MKNNLKKICFFLSFLLVSGLVISSKTMTIHADNKNFVVNEVWDANFMGPIAAKQHDDDSSVYIIEGDNIDTGYLEIHASFGKKPDKVELKDSANSESYQLSYDTDGSTLTIYASPPVSGAYQIDVYLTFGESVEKYTIIVNGNSYYGTTEFDTNLYLKDVTNDLIYGDEGWFLKGLSSVKIESSVKKITVDNSTKEVAVQVHRSSEIEEKFNADIKKLSWISDGANKVRINGGEWKQVNGTGDTTGDFWSPSLTLKKGLNIVEVRLEYLRGYLSNSSGFSDIKKTDDAVSYMYLLYWDGEETEREKSSETSIDYMNAVQLGGSGVPAISYGIGKDDEGTSYIALPEAMPSVNGEVYDKILFGAVPTDCNATVSVQEEVIVGEKAGIYQAVKVTDDSGKLRDNFKVTVTAEDGTVEEHIIKLVQLSSDCSIDSCEIEEGTLSDVDTGKELSYTSDRTVYCLSVANSKLRFKMDIADDAVLKVNDKILTSDEEGYFECEADELINVVEVVAADKINKKQLYLVMKNDDGTIPFFGQTKENIDLAQSMLDAGWTKRSDDEVKNMTTTYWDVFKSKATNISFENATVYDIDGHKFKQATDWAACILEAVMIGENPYDYGENHINLVQGLKESGSNGYYGPYANNHWTLMALKAVGEDIEQDYSKLLETMINHAYVVNDYKDTRAWAMAAVADYLTTEQIIELAFSLNETRKEDGFWGNSYTDGCQFTAIAEMGINIDYYAKELEDGTSVGILESFKAKKMFEDGTFDNDGRVPVYVKDIIIGLGDLVNEESVWASLRLTNDKLKILLGQAEDVLAQDNLDEDAKADLKTAYDAAKAKENAEYGFGEEYYALRKAMSNASEEYNEQIRTCTWKESKAVDAVIEQIAEIGDITIGSGETIDSVRSAYDALDSDKVKGYVTNYEILVKAEADFAALEETYIADLTEKIVALGDVDDLTLEQKAAVEDVKALYDALSDSQKKEVANGKTVAKAVNKIVALEVEALIEALPTEITLENDQAVKDARAAYDALTKAQKRYVLSENVVKLDDAEETIVALKEEAGIPVITVTLDKTEVILKQDTTTTLKATVSNGEVVFWSSSNPEIANVDNSGVVTTYKDGTTVITAATADGTKATCTVTVDSKLQAKAKPSTKSIKLTWKKIADADGYIVYRYDSSTKKYKKIATLGAGKTSYTVKKVNGSKGAALKSGTSYTFKVCSYVEENGKKVVKKSEVIKTATKPAKVTISKLAKKSSKKVKITWKKVKGTGYQVWMKTGKNGKYKLVKTVKKSSTTSYTKGSLKKGKTYYFKIRAYKTVNGKTIYGSYSKVKSIKLK